MWLQVLTKCNTRTVDNEGAQYNKNLKDPEKWKALSFHTFCLNYTQFLSPSPPPPPNQLLSVQDLSSDLIETHHYIAVFQRDIIVDYFVSLPLGFVLLGS